MAALGTNELVIIALLSVMFLIPLLALIDILRNQFKDSSNKIIWALIVLFFPILGGILYFLFGVKQKVSKIDF
ncbi:PLD nuclease N-terminal domain-containing protein [Niabella yanshanensis]|uniref:PLD nuclease N-terminal domain-containing protein n=1 Tax=Niabella yanshanensis TaxID=577386 RepID=A0ABZ0WAP4_9BACT|nr:PLD nuclease N-terminal domain-containing protein [Niabella yanshanensis]WQD40358.1 PLD nuclease N-terminal domain-containing protein [Niabella yanshanensis]